MGLEATLRAAIAERVEAGETVYQIAKGCGIGQPVLSRFVHKERTLTLRTADKLAAYLGLELRPVAKAKSKRK